MTELRAPLAMASIVAGLAYPLVWGSGLPDGATIVLKGLGVGLLALLAATQARSRDGWLLAVVMAFGAFGDVLLEIRFEAGVAAFAIGHLAAILLYSLNRRRSPSPTQVGLAAMLLLFGATMPFLLLGNDDSQFAGLTLYSLLLTLMASMAWLSRFPRYRTGIGALLFVLSDTLIAARMGPLADRIWVSYAVWLSYYVGQLLIFVGVSATLREPRP